MGRRPMTCWNVTIVAAILSGSHHSTLAPESIGERSKLIVELQKNGEQQVTLKEILNPVGGDSLLIKFLKTTQLIQRI